MRAIWVETIETCAKFNFVTRDFAVEAGVSDDSINAIVQAVLKIAGPGMRVASSPAGEQNFANVGLVIAISVLQEKRVRRLVDDQATVRKREARGNAQLVG